MGELVRQPICQLHQGRACDFSEVRGTESGTCRDHRSSCALDQPKGGREDASCEPDPDGLHEQGANPQSQAHGEESDGSHRVGSGRGRSGALRGGPRGYAVGEPQPDPEHQIQNLENRMQGVESALASILHHLESMSVATAIPQ